jgi:hypothetical protein
MNFPRVERRYVVRLFLAMAAYLILLFAVRAWLKTSPPSGALLYGAAVLPALPILAAIWAVGRYIVEEADEYRRKLLVESILWATGITLAGTTVWGFLETFAGAIRVPSTEIFMFFCVALGVVPGGRSILALR